jgi:hypothetical protein
MNNMNKSLGLLKSMMKKNNINKHQTMEINHSNRYSPSKKPKRQIISINKASKADYNSNIEKKKIIYQQSIQKLDKSNKLKLSQNKKNMEINQYYKNNNKSYVDLFQNNIYNSNDYIMPRGGRTISNSIYEKIYDFENENINYNNVYNFENNSTNEYNSTLVEEVNNIINVLINYINIIKNEYGKIITQKIENKDKEIIKLKNENEFLIKENKKLKYKILEIFYCVKTFYSNKDKNESKSNFSIKQLLNENLFLRNCINKTNNLNKDYLIKLENDIMEQFKYKELLNTKKLIEEEKNNEENNIDIIADKEKGDKQLNNEINNPFKFINENSSNNSNNNKVNHKRQKTQFKLNLSDKNKNDSINNFSKTEEENEQNNININNSDTLSGYLNIMNNNILLSRTKNGSQKNLLINKNNTNYKKDNNINNEDNNNTISDNNNNISSEQSYDSIIHNDINNNKIKNQNENEFNNEKENNLNKKIPGLNSTSTFDKYSQRIEFTK